MRRSGGGIVALRSDRRGGPTTLPLAPPKHALGPRHAGAKLTTASEVPFGLQTQRQIPEPLRGGISLSIKAAWMRRSGRAPYSSRESTSMAIQRDTGVGLAALEQTQAQIVAVEAPR